MTFQTSRIRHPERLRRLVALLRADADRPDGVQFDLGVWAQPSAKGLEFPDPEKVPMNCGTRACAFGLAAISGEFAAEGLVLMQSSTQLVPTIFDQDGAMHRDFGAAAYLFGIEPEAAEYLFDPGFYGGTPTAASGEREVAERIEEFLDDGRYAADPYDEPYDEDDEELTDC